MKENLIKFIKNFEKELAKDFSNSLFGFKRNLYESKINN